MKRSSKTAVVAGVAVLMTAGSMGLASAVGGDDSESEAPISGEALKEATEAALAHTGGGRVTDTETGDEESYYEVEVTLPTGEETDVQLNRSFEVVGSETESGSGDESESETESESGDDD